MNNFADELEKAVAASKAAIFDLIEHNELLDEDGYPTDAALDAIKLWHFSDARGWFKFIEGLWWSSSMLWREDDVPHDLRGFKGYEDKMVHRYWISTGGWSGNESIIRAMQENNHMLWTLNWVQSRRGGHYIFELREFKDD
jgi:hypothetical protein